MGLGRIENVTFQIFFFLEKWIWCMKRKWKKQKTFECVLKWRFGEDWRMVIRRGLERGVVDWESRRPGVKCRFRWSLSFESFSPCFVLHDTQQDLIFEKKCPSTSVVPGVREGIDRLFLLRFHYVLKIIKVMFCLRCVEQRMEQRHFIVVKYLIFLDYLTRVFRRLELEWTYTSREGDMSWWHGPG